MVRIKLKVEGMTCQGCASTVEEYLRRIDGVQSVKVNLEDGTVTVLADTDIPEDVFKEKVSEAGYSFAGVITHENL